MLSIGFERQVLPAFFALANASMRSFITRQSCWSFFSNRLGNASSNLGNFLGSLIATPTSAAPLYTIHASVCASSFFIVFLVVWKGAMPLHTWQSVVSLYRMSLCNIMVALNVNAPLTVPESIFTDGTASNS